MSTSVWRELIRVPALEVQYEIFGDLPIQALGVVRNREFYFRLRHGEWTFEVADERGDLMSDHDQKQVFYRQGKVSHVDSTSETAKAQILCCLEEYLESCDQ
jgi:hypothetical protein